MTKMKGAIIVVAISVILVITGAVLEGITMSGNFQLTSLAGALSDIGMLSAVLSGITLVVIFIVDAVSGKKKE